MSKHVKGPWDNPTIEDGIYEAKIGSVRHTQLGDDDGEMLELTFWLKREEQHFVSRLYMPKAFSSKVQSRLRFLCGAIGLSAEELIEYPSQAAGRELQLEITTIHPSIANHGRPYSDVKRFLPKKTQEQDQGASTKSVDLTLYN